MKHSEKLENALKDVESVLSEFIESVSEVQAECVPGPDMAEVARWQALAQIYNDASAMNNVAHKIRAKIEQLKALGE